MHTPAPKALALRTSAVTYPGSAEHISRVRADLRPLLRDCPIADEIALCASELAANAAIHSRSRLPSGTFTVLATISPGNYVRMKSKTTAAPGPQPSATLPGRTDWISSARWLRIAASTATARAAPSGHNSIGPATRNRSDVRATCRVPLRACL